MSRAQHFLQDCMYAKLRLNSACASEQSDIRVFAGHSACSQGSELLQEESEGFD